MLYSIFNSDGKGYGTFFLPDTSKTAEVLAHELGDELKHILGFNAVKSSPLLIGSSGEMEDRVFVDVGSVYSEEATRITLVHSMIYRLTAPNAE